MNSSLNSVVNENLVPRTPLYQSSEAPAAGSGRQIVELWSFHFSLTEVGRVDGIEDRPVDFKEGVTRIYGQLPDLLVVLWVGIVVVAVRPQPELGVGVEGVAQDWDWIQAHHEVSDVPHLHLGESLGSTVGLGALVVTDASLAVVEAPVPVRVDTLAAQDRAVIGPCLPPHSVVLPAVGITVRVG